MIEIVDELKTFLDDAIVYNKECLISCPIEEVSQIRKVLETYLSVQDKLTSLIRENENGPHE